LKNKVKPIIGVVFLLGLAIYGYLQRFESKRPSSGHQAAPIRIGTNRALGTIAPYVARDRGLFEEQSIRAEVVDFNDVTTLMESLASGQLDVGLVGVAPTAIWQQRGVPLKIVASAGGGGHVLLTRNDTGIRDLQDLRGHKIATPKPGTVTDTLFRVHLLHELAGLDPERDVSIIPNMAAADMSTVLFVSKEVDAAITWEPFAAQAEAAYKNRIVLYDGAAEWRKLHPAATRLYPVSVVVSTQNFIDHHADTLRRFLAAYVQAVDFINQQPAAANQIISKETQLSPAVVAAARQRIDYSSDVDVDASLETLRWSVDLGYLKKLPSPAQLFDLRFLPHPVVH